MAPVMAKAGFHLRLPSHSLFLLQTRKPISHIHCSSISKSNHHHNHHHFRRQSLLLFSSWQLDFRRSRKCDSDAYGADNFNPDPKDDETEDFSDSLEQWFDVLEDYIDSIWIFKVLGSFGWTLPFILSSMLIATGPKSLLMALSLPLGQSTLAFALQRLQNGGKKRPTLKNKNKRRKPRVYSSRKEKFEGSAEWIGSKGPQKRKKRYQTPISKDDVSIGSNNRAEFRGWDELDAGVESSSGSSGRVGQESNGMKGGHEVKAKKGRLNGNYGGPLLLRMLISVFPFLSYWRRLL